VHKAREHTSKPYFDIDKQILDKRGDPTSMGKKAS
jgi:hypothetical protein